MTSVVASSSAGAIAAQLAPCDRLLIVAAAGLSIARDLPNNPYHNPADFRLHYPAAARAGYRTSYEAMGLYRDPRLSDGLRVGYLAQHFVNMRFRFPPTPAYGWLRDLAASFAPEQVFCWTSNVDGCFERSGFDPKRVWTTQGDMANYQCMRCGNIWNCEAQLRRIDAACTPEGKLTDISLAMRCPECDAPRAELRPSLRGGDWFDHSPYEPAQLALLAWLEDAIETKSNVAVLEVGVGPNTPVVTRIPAAAFASALVAAGGRCSYVRVNPDSPEPPSQNPHGDPDRLQFTRLREPWDCLESIVAATVEMRAQQGGAADAADAASGSAQTTAPSVDEAAVAMWKERYVDIFQSLQTRPRR